MFLSAGNLKHFYVKLTRAQATSFQVLYSNSHVLPYGLNYSSLRVTISLWTVLDTNVSYLCVRMNTYLIYKALISILLLLMTFTDSNLILSTVFTNIKSSLINVVLQSNISVCKSNPIKTALGSSQTQPPYTRCLTYQHCDFTGPKFHNLIFNHTQ